MLIRQYVAAGHLNRVTINRVREGWDVREERDDQVVRRVKLHRLASGGAGDSGLRIARPEDAGTAHD